MTILQAALARDRLGEYQAQAAIAALHADATSASETDWAQIVEWYDELLLPTGQPYDEQVARAQTERIPPTEIDRLVRRLEKLGHRVILEPVI